MGDIWDCIVIGAGPGGLAAAIYLGRFRRRVVVIDSGHSRAARIPKTRNHPGFPGGIGGRALLSRLRRQAEPYGAVFRDGHVEAILPQDGGFRVAVAGEMLKARAVLLACGVLDNEPRLPGVEDAVACGLLRICPICDGYEVTDQTVGVIGCNERGAHEALFLTTFTDDVTLIHVGPPASLPPEERSLLARARVELIETPIDRVILDRRRISALCLAPGEPRRFDALYSALGVTPRTGLARAAGAKLARDGRLIVGEHQETSIPMLYAAGDMVRGLNQITTAEAEAAIAATDIHNQLRKRDQASTRRVRQVEPAT